MGTICAPSHANIFMDYFEEKCPWRIQNNIQGIGGFFEKWMQKILSLKTAPSIEEYLNSYFKLKKSHKKVAPLFLIY